MQAITEKLRQAVGRYRTRSKDDPLAATRAVLAAVISCRRQLRDLERTEKGITQRAAREVSSALADLPAFNHLSQSKDVHRLHTRRLAEEHLEQLEERLRAVVKDLETGRASAINEWIAAHPVLSKLKHALSKRLPDNAYVLLFSMAGSGSVELETRAESSKRVFTRFRPHEFKSNAALYSKYHSGRTLVGAAIVADDALHSVIGTIPSTDEGSEPLKQLLALSKQAAGRPARDFIEANPVLQTLHELCKSRKLAKDAYILLFTKADQVADGEFPDWQLLTRTAKQGNILTRFYANDFSDLRRLFDYFSEQGTVCGAAAIKDKRLLEVFGEVPQPRGDEDHVDFLLRLSKKAVEQPMLDFISTNEILAGLHHLATARDLPDDCQVIVFTEQSGGSIMQASVSVRDKRTKGWTKGTVSLSDFQSPRFVHDNFSHLKDIVGASIIGEAGPRPTRDTAAAAQDSRSVQRRHAPRPTRRPVVLRALGRTPLKQHFILTPDIMTRLGISLDDV